MTKKILVALYDRATEAFANVATVHTPREAIRSLQGAIQDKSSPVAQNAKDYELWQVGSFDDQTGEITAHKERIARAEDLE